MTDKKFCEIESQFSGETIDKVDQLEKATFTGQELKDFLEFAINYRKETLIGWKIYGWLGRIIAFIPISLLILFSMTLQWIKQSINFLTFGGELIPYLKANDHKRIADVYNLLREKNEKHEIKSSVSKNE